MRVRGPGAGQWIRASVAQHLLGLDNCLLGIVAMTLNCMVTWSPSGLGTIVRIAAPTSSWLPFDTTARTLRIQPSRHRARVTPGNIVGVAPCRVEA